MMTETDSGSESRARGNVFISYSRADKAFARQIYLALEENGFSPLMDTQAINPAEPWQERLTSMIEECDSVVFVLTAPFLASEPCQFEVSEAGRLGKRMIPLVPAPLEDVSVPDALARLNYIFFYENLNKPDSGFFTGVSELRRGLLVNLDWLREARIYGERAKDYFDNPDNERLLRGSLLVHAQNWMDHCPEGESVDADTRRYIERSARRENDRILEREKEMRARARQARLTLMAGAFLCVLAFGGFFYSFIEAKRGEAARSDQFALVSGQLLRQGDAEGALIVALHGRPEPSLINASLSRIPGIDYEGTEAYAALALNRMSPLFESDYFGAVHLSPVMDVIAAPDGRTLISASSAPTSQEYSELAIWNTELRNGEETAVFWVPSYGRLYDMVLPAKPHLLVLSGDFGLKVIDLVQYTEAAAKGWALQSPDDDWDSFEAHLMETGRAPPGPLIAWSLDVAQSVAVSPRGNRIAFVSASPATRGSVFQSWSYDLENRALVFDARQDDQVPDPDRETALVVAYFSETGPPVFGTSRGRVVAGYVPNQTVCQSELGQRVEIIESLHDERRILVVDAGGKIMICDVKTGERENLRLAAPFGSRIAVSASGSEIAVLTGQTLSIQQLADRSIETYPLSGYGEVSAIAFSGHPGHFLIGDASGRIREIALEVERRRSSRSVGTVAVTEILYGCASDAPLDAMIVDAEGRLFRAGSRVEELSLFPEPVHVTALSCASELGLLVVGTDKGELVSLDLATGETRDLSSLLPAEMRPRGEVADFVADPDNARLVAVYRSGAMVELRPGEQFARRFQSPPSSGSGRGATAVEASAVRAAIALPASNPSEPGGMALLDERSGILQHRIEGSPLIARRKWDRAGALNMAADGAASGHFAFEVADDYGDSLMIYNALDDSYPMSLFAGNFEIIAISPNGELVATGTEFGYVSIYRVRGNLLLDEVSLADSVPVTALEFSPDADRLAVGLGNGLLVEIPLNESGDIDFAELRTAACARISSVRIREVLPQLFAQNPALERAINAHPCGD